MYQVLIVDDEKKVRQLIRILIDWERLGLHCVGLAESAEQALSILNTQTVDIILTDIRMSSTNGLSLIQNVQKMYPGIRCVIISGYREFDYAHAAMQMHVQSYLLKPINEQELNQVLKQICKELDSRATQRMQNTVLLEQESLLRRNELHTLVSASTSERKMLAIHYPPVGTCYRMLCVHLYPRGEHCLSEYTVQKGKLSLLVRSALQSNGIDHTSVQYESSLYVLIGGDSFVLEESGKQLLRELRACRTLVTVCHVVVSASTTYQDIAMTGDAITQTEYGIRQRLQCGVDQVIYMQGVIPNAPDVGTVLTAERRKTFLRLLEGIQIEQMADWFFGTYQAVRSQAENISELAFVTADQIFSLFRDFWSTLDAQSDWQRLTEQYAAIVDISITARELFDHMENLVRDEMHGYYQKKMETGKKPIHLAKQYICENYADKLTLEDVATLVGMNATYFSVLFKRETGISFLDYVVQVRMNAARELLKTSDDRIGDIAYRVGYTDPRYFSRIFLKTVGLKPTEYRRLHYRIEVSP